MKRNLNSFLCGLIFALGLGISSMTQPQKVIGFLNILTDWDSTLLFVMLGAVSVHALVFRLTKTKSRPLFEGQWHLPTKNLITAQLIFGSLIFGIGWGLAGFCPGPAIVSLVTLKPKIVIFVVSMAAGMYLHRAFETYSHKI